MKIAGLEVDFLYEAPRKNPRKTFCIIDTENGPVEGIAVCKHRDVFSKGEGRKRAFKNALKKFRRTDREKLWASYFEQLPQDKQ